MIFGVLHPRTSNGVQKRDPFFCTPTGRLVILKVQCNMTVTRTMKNRNSGVNCTL